MNTEMKNKFTAMLIELNAEYTKQEVRANNKRDFERLVELAKLKDSIDMLLEDLDK